MLRSEFCFLRIRPPNTAAALLATQVNLMFPYADKHMQSVQDRIPADSHAEGMNCRA